jgi:hypothetical protein
VANGLLTQAEKPFFSLSMPLDQSMSRAESSPYQPQLPQSHEPYDLKSLVSNTFQTERDQIEQLTDMSEKFRQRAALTGNALERNRLNAQATIWENRATGLVEKIGESTTDDTVEELQGIFANLKKQDKLPQTESQYAQFMFNHGYNDKEDHDAYKFVWSSFSPPPAGDVKRFTFSDGKERRRGYSTIVDGVPRYFFENGDDVPEGWRVQSITGSDTNKQSTALTKTNEEIALIDKMDLAADTFG